MTRTREILEALPRDELLAILDAHELQVPDRRLKAAVLDAITGAHSVDLRPILGDFPRDRLKEICRDLGLDDSGREKAVLVERMLTPPNGTPRPPKANGTSKAGPHEKNDVKRRRGRNSVSSATATEQLELPQVTPEAVLTTEQLARYLEKAAEILRGSIDSSDFKNYILGMFFLKRLSDRFDEECDALRAEGADPEDSDEHEFFVPPRARWSQIQKTATNVGEVLNKACAAVEDANSRLEGVLLGFDFNDERKLGDGKQRDSTLARLVQHFSRVNLRNSKLAEPDMLGRAYERLIEYFADDAGKKGGEFYTPKKVVELIVKVLDPKEGMRICDPTCGSGGMLIEAARHVRQRSGNPKNLSLFGQEKNLGTWGMCKMNMLLHGVPDARIEKGDTIRDPKLVAGGELMVFDMVVANPPFSLDDWGREVAEHDAWGRFRFGLPPKTKGDLAFVQHMVSTLNPTGKLGVVMPHGVLFRGSSEAEIRKGFIEEDLIEAVIGLPPNLFFGTGIPAAVLIMNRAKPKARKERIIFVEASREFREGSAQNFLRDEDVAKIARAVHEFRDVERYARTVSLDEVKKNDFNLNITRYVETAEQQEKVDVRAALAKLREAEAARDAAKAIMDHYLRELGLAS